MENTVPTFPHRHSAHCESGVTANLLCAQGFEISEAMVFGIGSGLFFAYMPFIKVNFLPFTTFRVYPGGILKRVTARLGIKVKKQKFRNPEKSMRALDDLIAQNIPVGVQVGVYWLPFFPPAFRFHFNGHNMVVYGKQEGNYLISDPVWDTTVVCPHDDLMKARFSKGPLAPKGFMYYIQEKPENVLLEKVIIKGIKEVCNAMLKNPFPFFGIKGIHYLAKQIGGWPERFGEEEARQYIGQVIRMQEEIGTGGAGFRYLYATFLQEAAPILKNDALFKLAETLTDIGDRWREFAVCGARHCKKKVDAQTTYPQLSEILTDCAEREQKFFTALRAQVI